MPFCSGVFCWNLGLTVAESLLDCLGLRLLSQLSKPAGRLGGYHSRYSRLGDRLGKLPEIYLVYIGDPFRSRRVFCLLALHMGASLFDFETTVVPVDPLDLYLHQK